MNDSGYDGWIRKLERLSCNDEERINIIASSMWSRGLRVQAHRIRVEREMTELENKRRESFNKATRIKLKVKRPRRHRPKPKTYDYHDGRGRQSV